MGYYRVTFGGYIEGEFESKEAAVEALVDHIEDEKLDVYGRTWKELIEVEEIR